MKSSIQESVFRLSITRWVTGLVFLCRAAIFMRRHRPYRAVRDFCWVARVSNIGLLTRIAERSLFRLIDDVRRSGRNTLIDSYLQDPASETCASLYSLTGKGRHDLFRDVMVLKRSTADEKGVIMLKYARTFEAVVSLFDLPALMARYTFVLEPCWAGYWDTSILMFLTAQQPVVVQCFTEEDRDVIARIGSPLVPVSLGPADWVNADLFRPPQNDVKTHDVVMVANWGVHKRHAELFRALARIRNRDVRVLLIGFPWAGRTADDIRRAAAAIGNPRVHVDVIENVPPSQVATHVGRCRAFVFLSRKEGDNKALVEAMFTNVPAVVYDRTVGGARSRINAATGVLSSDDDLADKIQYVIDHPQEFSPRAWVLERSGSANATKTLNDVVGHSVIASGGRYTHDIVEKTNSPNLAYKDPAVRAKFQADYEFILSCRRNAPEQMTQVKRPAVA